VLTAAHCIGTIDLSSITITAGLHNKFNNEVDTRQVLTVSRIFKHPNYNDVTHENDLAILRLAERVQFNKYVQPACLPGCANTLNRAYYFSLLFLLFLILIVSHSQYYMDIIMILFLSFFKYHV
jgi:hypothetical protein